MRKKSIGMSLGAEKSGGRIQESGNRYRGRVEDDYLESGAVSQHFSPHLDVLSGLPEGRGFSPDGIAAPALCWSRAPRSPAPAGLR
ncbi:MAG: hypothetical protein WB763_16005, partial [Terriglobia bacterium]